jgi:hypothetical protein
LGIGLICVICAFAFHQLEKDGINLLAFWLLELNKKKEGIEIKKSKAKSKRKSRTCKRECVSVID